MGINIGEHFSFEIYRAITHQDPYYRVRLRKQEQQRLLEVARTAALVHSSPPGLPHVIERSPENCARDYAMIAVMLYGGVSVDEVVGLKADAISEEDGIFWVSFIATDGKHRRHPLISKMASEAVNYYLSLRGYRVGEGDSLFLTTTPESAERKALTPRAWFSLLSALMREAQVESERITPFALLNSFAKEFLDAGHNVKELQKILRIRRSDAMKIYVSELDCRLINYEERPGK